MINLIKRLFWKVDRALSQPVKTRCRPGDIAYYKGKHEKAYGSIVRCVRIAQPQPEWAPVDGAWWLVEPAIFVDGLWRNHAADSVLTPIRDPGDDAVDETLQWLPAPTIHSQIKEDKSQEVAHG